MAIGLTQLIDEDPNLELLDDEVLPSAIERLDRAPRRPTWRCSTSARSPARPRSSSCTSRFPSTRLVVLANRPTAVECNQMLSFGATACLSKETQGRDVVNAIHLASRGMHVLPRSAAAGGNGDLGRQGLRPAHPARGRRARAAPGRRHQRPDRADALDRARDRAHARAQHLPQARHLLAPRPGPARRGRDGRWSTRRPAPRRRGCGAAARARTSSSATCTALVAAPLRRLSPTTHRFRQRSCEGSRRMRPTSTSSWPARVDGQRVEAVGRVVDHQHAGRAAEQLAALLGRERRRGSAR